MSKIYEHYLENCLSLDDYLDYSSCQNTSERFDFICDSIGEYAACEELLSELDNAGCILEKICLSLEEPIKGGDWLAWFLEGNSASDFLACVARECGETVIVQILGKLEKSLGIF